MAPPRVEAVPKATLKQRSILPSENQGAWIARINGEPIAQYLGKNAHPKQVQRYHIPAGKDQIAVMFEGTGMSDRVVPMFEDSVTMHFEFHARLKQPVVFEIATEPGQTLTIETYASRDTCTVSVVNQAIVLARNSGSVRYTYTNIWQPENWYLNQEHADAEGHGTHR